MAISTSGGTLIVRGTGVGSDSSITIENFHQGDFGITLAPTRKVGIFEQIPLIDPWMDPANPPVLVPLDVFEGRGRVLSLVLDAPAAEGQFVR